MPSMMIVVCSLCDVRQILVIKSENILIMATAVGYTEAPKGHREIFFYYLGVRHSTGNYLGVRDNHVID